MIYPVYGTKCPPPGYYGWGSWDASGHKPTPEEEYHAWSALSGSFMANHDNWKSARHAKSELNRARDASKIPTPAMMMGTALSDRLLLDCGPTIERMPDGEPRKKTAIADSQSRGAVLLKDSEADAIERMGDAIDSNPRAAELLVGVNSPFAHVMREASMVWREHGILCKGRADQINMAHGAATVSGSTEAVLIDVKTTSDASSYKFEKTIFDRGYHIQLDHYLSGILHTPLALEGAPENIRSLYTDGHPIIEHRSQVRVAIIAVENVAPYGCTVFWMDDWMDLAAETRSERLATFRHATERDEWRGYPTHYTSAPPQWALRDKENDTIREVADVV